MKKRLFEKLKSFSKKRALIIFLIFLTAILACLFFWWRWKVGRERPVKQAVQAYIRRLPQALANFNSEVLQGVATPSQLSRIRTYFIYLEGNNRTVLAKASKLKFNSVKLGKSKAEVETEEVWEFVDFDLKTKRPLDSSKRTVYNVKYMLVLEQNNWLIDDYDILKEREIR